MAARLDSFGLAELAAKPEDAFRLAGLAMAEGIRVAGYRGDYYRYRMGDAEAVIRTMNDPETGQEELLGMDTHAASACIWDCQVVKVVTPEDADPMSCRVLVRCGEGDARAVVDLVCPEVLPAIEAWDRLRLGMAAFPLRVSYDQGESSGVVEAQQNASLLQGVVKGCGALPPDGAGGGGAEGQYPARGSGERLLRPLRRRSRRGLCGRPAVR